MTNAERRAAEHARTIVSQSARMALDELIKNEIETGKPKGYAFALLEQPDGQAAGCVLITLTPGLVSPLVEFVASHGNFGMRILGEDEQNSEGDGNAS